MAWNMGRLRMLRESLACPQRNSGSEGFPGCPRSHSWYVAMTPASAKHLVPPGTRFPVWKWEHCLLPCGLVVRVKLGTACEGVI